MRIINPYIFPASDAWLLDLANASYDNVSHDFNQASGYPSGGLCFKPDGLKGWFVNATTDDVIEFTMSSAWDISTITISNTLDVSGKELSVASLFFKPDGTKLFITGYSSDKLHSYTMSSAWDITTASFSETSDIVTGFSPQGLFFKPDGTVCYVYDFNSSRIRQFSLSSAWDCSVITDTNKFYSQHANGIFINSDGTLLLTCDTTSDEVRQHTLSTSWDISTASYDSIMLSVNSQEGFPYGFAIKPDGSKFYISGFGDKIYQYSGF